MKEKPKEEGKKRVIFASAINPNEDELEEFIEYVSSLCTGKEEDEVPEVLNNKSPNGH